MAGNDHDSSGMGFSARCLSQDNLTRPYLAFSASAGRRWYGL